MPSGTPVPDPAKSYAAADPAKTGTPKPMSRRRSLIGATALALGGRAPLTAK